MPAGDRQCTGTSRGVVPQRFGRHLLGALSGVVFALQANAQAVAPDDIACRPDGNATDAVDVSWVDTNGGVGSYDLQRRPTSGGGNWSVIASLAAADCDDDGTCELTDSNASTADVYRYRVVTQRDGDTANSSVCREPRWLDSALTSFRIFYRLNECPDVDGKQVCVQNVTSNGQNYYASRMASIFEQYRSEYIGLGFNETGVWNGGPFYPVDLFPCDGGGCANGRGIQMTPKNLEGAPYDQDTGTGNANEYRISGHELFHKVEGEHGGSADPFYKWVIEGQARAMEDKACVFNQARCAIWDDLLPSLFTNEVATYLDRPELGLQEQSYAAALFWTKVMEQFAGVTTEPELGSDVMLDFWLENEANEAAGNRKDGIGTLNDFLVGRGIGLRFEDVFANFAAANYAKDYISPPVPAALEDLNYLDEETLPGGSYGTVKLTSSGSLSAGQPVSGTHSIDAWGARYFQVDPDASVSVVDVEVEALPGTPNEMYFHVFGIQGGTITYQHSDTGTRFGHVIPNLGFSYDRIGLVVASLGRRTNFDWGFNRAAGLRILSPTQQNRMHAGDPSAPDKFVLRVEVVDEAGSPVAGIARDDLVVLVEGTQVHPTPNPANSPIVAFSYIAGQYWISMRAPASPGCAPDDRCNVSVEYSGLTDTEFNALTYGGANQDADNMIVIDRSGSMAGAKIAAAKEAAKVYIDAYDVGDRIGILSYNDLPTLEKALGPWTDFSRLQALNSITGMDPPMGETAIGLGLRSAQQWLIDQTLPNPRWSMILLSDGADTVANENDHLPAFIEEYETRKDAGDTVPEIHVVAIGDDADGVALEELVDASNGTFQWLTEVGAGQTAEQVFANELGEIYRVVAEEVLGEQQVMARLDSGFATVPIYVDFSASQGVFVAKWSPETAPPPSVTLRNPLDSSVGAPTRTWAGHSLWRIPTPMAGTWDMVLICDAPECADQFLTEAAVVSDLTLEVFLGLPKSQRDAGRPMPVVALLSDLDPLLGATVTITVPRTGEVRTMFDDGRHGDGEADDGFYGATLLDTNAGGGYTAIVEATGFSPLTLAYQRRQRVGFFMQPGVDDDGDGLPTWWEEENGLDPDVADPQSQDPDKDGLTTLFEFQVTKTNPLDSDTDDGGESDGSEWERTQNAAAPDANPFDPGDDLLGPPRVRAWAGVNQNRVRFSSAPGVGVGPYSTDATELDIYGARRRGGVLEPFQLLAEDHPIAGGEWIDDIQANWGAGPDGDEYCYCLVARGDYGIAFQVRFWSGTTELACATPGPDPNPPHGEVALSPPSGGGLAVTLDLVAQDDPKTEEHQPFDGAILDALSTSSGVTEMMVSDRADFESASWQPYQGSLPWTLVPRSNGVAHVFVKYRDAAGNVSETVSASIAVPEPVGALPLGIGLLAVLARRRRSARSAAELPD